jgi:hypothetical protein
MTTMKCAIALLALSLAGSSAKAWDQDFFDSYLQRSDKITLGAGNAHDTNAVTHMVDPWPPYVGDRRIPANGQRMVGAVERYRECNKRPAVPPILPIYTDLGGQGAGGSGGGGGGGGAGAPGVGTGGC